MGKVIETSFDNFYDKFDQTEFQGPWENVINEKKKSFRIALIICTIVDLAVFIILILEQSEFNLFVALLQTLFFSLLADTFIVAFSNICRNMKSDIKYRELYKSRFIYGMLNNFFDNVNYQPIKGIGRTVYDSGLYKEYYNEYTTDDFAEVLFNNKNTIRLAEVHTVDVETHTDSDGHRHTTRTTRFHGIFAQIILDKRIGCHIRVRQNHLFKQHNEIEMDHAEFEKIFDVDSNDRIKAMQFLTHDVMEELIYLRKSTGCPFDILIKDNIIYLRLHTGAVFEPYIDKKEVIFKKTAHRYFNTLKFLYNLTDKVVKNLENNEF